jgi:drug/metabolite transporter (DMT)-like permease
MPPMDPERRSPRLGYALAAVAAALFALNGILARFLLDDGVSAMHLSQLRSTLSFVLPAGGLALVDRRRLRVARADVPRLAWLGIAGLALVHATYFAAIERLEISVALVMQYLGPLLVLLWLRFVHGRRLSRALWGAVALSVAGSARRGRSPGSGSRRRGTSRSDSASRCSARWRRSCSASPRCAISRRHG